MSAEHEVTELGCEILDLEEEIERLKKLVKLSVDVVEELMPGIGGIVCDIGRLNDFLIEAEKVKVDGGN